MIDNLNIAASPNDEINNPEVRSRHTYDCTDGLESFVNTPATNLTIVCSRYAIWEKETDGDYCAGKITFTGFHLYIDVDLMLLYN